MSGQAPEGWVEVFHGPCVRADVLRAVLENSGLHPVSEQLSPQGWWSGPVIEDCRIYVTEEESARARDVLTTEG